MKKSRLSVRYRRILKILREVREEAGLTQGEVGKKFGSYASFVSKVESGERRLDIIELADFCKLYGIPLAVFLSRAGIV